MKNKKLKKTVHIVVGITPVQIKMIINQIGKDEGVTISDFIRKSINQQLYNNQTNHE